MKFADAIFALTLAALVLACRADGADLRSDMQTWLAQGSALVDRIPAAEDPVDPPPLVDPPTNGAILHGLPVVKTVGGFRVVDIRPALAKAAGVNQRAKDALAWVNAKTPICDVVTPSWKSFSPSSAQRSLAIIPIPASAKVLTFSVKKSSGMWVAMGMWWDGNKWNAAQIGASRENKFDHLYDFGTADWIPAGWLYKDWSPVVSKAAPSVVVLFDFYKAAISYGVVVGGAQ